MYKFYKRKSNKMNEIWKDIFEYEGKYQISNYGKVKSVVHIINYKNGHVHKWSEHFLTIGTSKTGYKTVALWKNNKEKRLYVHRLVAEAFIPNYDNKSEVNHIEPVTKEKCDNKVCNLEWVTSKENSQWSIELGRASKPPIHFGKNHPRHKSIYQINENGIIENYWNCIADACRTGEYERHSIIASCKDMNRTYKGFKWFYAEDYERVCHENNNK